MARMNKKSSSKLRGTLQDKDAVKAASRIEGKQNKEDKFADEFYEESKVETEWERERKELERQKKTLEEKAEALRLKLWERNVGFQTTLPSAIDKSPERVFSIVPKILHRKRSNTSALMASAPKPENRMTALEKMTASRKGFSKKELEQLKEKTGLDYDQLAQLLDVARTTLLSKKGEDRFSPGLSEKIMSIADIYSYGYEIFGDQQEFNQWVFQPIPALGSKSPYDFLSSHYGREEVRNIIGRIAYGVYS